MQARNLYDILMSPNKCIVTCQVDFYVPIVKLKAAL